MITSQELHRIEMQQAIENYILGKLTQQEIDQLWIKFLKAPEWFNYFLTEIHLRSVVMKTI